MRSVDPQDARKYQLQLTEKGQQVSREIESRFAEEIARSFEKVDREQVTVLVNILESLVQQ